MKKLYLLFLLISTCYFAEAQLVRTAVPAAELKEEIRSVKFYPNPAVSNINFEFQKGYDKNYTLQIYNFVGKKVYETSVQSQKTNIPLTDFFRGVYIFQLRDKTGKIIESGKFQVSK